jgi:microcin C transport system permease protein
MLAYTARRLLLMIPTLFGIMVLNFFIVQLAPGGPVEQMIAKVQGSDVSAVARFSGGTGGEAALAERSLKQGTAEGAGSNSKYRGAQGLSPEVISQIEKDFGFDKPIGERFLLMIRHYLVFDFGESYFQNRKVVDLVKEKLPVSISLGLWTTLLIYCISIPLGIAKATRDGTAFDIWTSVVIVVGYAIPGFLFAVLLIVLFAGGSFMQIFPFRGLVSDNWHELSLGGKIVDYFWHITLPVLSLVIGGFASLTMLTKNSFLDEIGKQYVLTAKAKGLAPRAVLYKHIFRNAMLIVIAGFPSAFIGILFTGALLIEVIFSLDGMGLLGFQAAINRDYPIMFGTLYVFTFLGLVLNLISDLAYVAVDPRINFGGRR